MADRPAAQGHNYSGGERCLLPRGDNGHGRTTHKAVTMAERKHTRATRARNAKVVRDGNGICWLCGHEGADAADHKIPIAQGGSDTIDNLAPAHHFTECDTCGIKCNRAKSDKLIAPVMRLTPGLNRP